MTKRVALVAGATGAAAKRLVEVLLSDPAWTVLGVSRRPPAARHARFIHIGADLLSPDSLAARGEALGQITHAFYCSRAPFKEGGVEDTETNAAMLRHTLDALCAHAPALEHVHLVEGGKWYGLHLGPFPTPAREDAPRHMPPNFYYDQEDLLRARQAGRGWSWTASRPMYVYDFAPERARNLVSVIGMWAAMCREVGMALEFPGKPRTWRALADMSDATHLARAQVWMATTPAARNEAYNVTDGEPLRWCNLWPRIAGHFGLACGAVRTHTLGTWMADKAGLWSRIVEKHQLRPVRMEDLAVWSFGDFVWHQDYDVVLSTLKIRKAGFAEVVDSEERILSHMTRYQEERLLPT